LNKGFSFSTSRTNQICEKFLKVQFSPPLELGLNLILHIYVLLGHYSLLPRMKPIMLLRGLLKLSRMKRITVFLPLNLIMGENFIMKDLTNSVANMDSNTNFQHQELHNRME